MNALRTVLFGRFQVLYQNEPLKGLEGRKAQELLGYLLLNRHRSHTREALADLLWDDCPPGQARGYLRKSLWQVQDALESQVAPEHNHILLVESEWLQINPCSEVWLDVGVFEQAYKLIRGVSGEAMTPVQAQAVESALELYHSDLLDGWYANWCFYERERLRRLYLIMLEKLVSYHAGQHAYEAAINYSLRLLAYERTHEGAHRQLMQLYYQMGDRAAGLRQFELCQAALAEELGVRPAWETVALYEQIREGQLEPVPANGARGNGAFKTAMVGTPELLNRLTEMQGLLAAMTEHLRCLN